MQQKSKSGARVVVRRRSASASASTSTTKESRLSLCPQPQPHNNMLLRRTSSTIAASRVHGRARRAVLDPKRRARTRSRASSEQGQQNYPYQSGEGRNKATIEHIFSPDSDDDSEGDPQNANNANNANSAADAAAAEERRHRRSALGAAGQARAPWGIGWQMSERNIVWNDDLKLRLIKHVTAQKLGCTPDELERRLALLAPLLPQSLGPLLNRCSADTCVRLADNASVVAARLLRLKALFPKADVEAMVSARLSLLLDEDLDDVAAAREALAGPRALAGGRICVDRFVEAFPQVLSARGAEFERAVEDAFRLLPTLKAFEASGGVADPDGAAALAVLLRQDPDKVLALMKGSCLISYDQVSNPFTPAGGMVINAVGKSG
jgi:hypothetical protein